jgi:hypothetical protein
VKEVLRLYPAIPVFPREAAADDVLPTGHPVSAGEAAQGVFILRSCSRQVHLCMDIPYSMHEGQFVLPQGGGLWGGCWGVSGAFMS